jgi:nucleotide-binding universal stress UspA family protein
MADEVEGEVSSTGGGSRQPAAEKGPSQRDASHLPVSYTIAAVLPEAATAPSVLHGLEQLAKLLPAARLVALHVEVDPRHLVADDEEIVVQRLREKREGTAAERAVAVRKVFDEWWHSNGSIGARTTWRKLVGAEETALIQAMKDIDLAILPRPGNLDSQDALHAAIFSHRLVLIMPPSAAAGTGFCRHVAIGWKPGKLVDEVVLLSMPILRIAERVTLLAIDQQDADFSHDYVLRTLVELGVEPELIRIDSSGSQVGHRLLDEARRIGAGSLIVGAYRRGQMIEQILGGVTRELVAQSDIPLFLAH